MAPAAVQDGGPAAGKAPPSGFWAKVRSLHAEARIVGRLSEQKLLVSIENDDAVPNSPVALQEIGALEQAIQRIRQRLENAVGTDAAFPESAQATRFMVARGELLDATAFAARMGWTRQALSKALAARRIFFIEHAGVRYFPAFYADPQNERRHLEAVSRLLGDLPGGAKLQFFLNARGSLGKLTPLQALRKGRLDPVKRAAQAFASA